MSQLAPIFSDDDLFMMGFEPYDSFISGDDFESPVVERVGDGTLRVNSTMREDECVATLPMRPDNPVPFPQQVMILEAKNQAEVALFDNSLMNGETFAFALDEAETPDSFRKHGVLAPGRQFGAACVVLSRHDDPGLMPQYRILCLGITGLTPPPKKAGHMKPGIMVPKALSTKSLPKREQAQYMKLENETAVRFAVMLEKLAQPGLEPVQTGLDMARKGIADVLSYIAFHSPITRDKKLSLIAMPPLERAKALSEMLANAQDELQVVGDVLGKTQQEITDQNRENYLRQQLQIIRNELGERGQADGDDISRFRQRASEMKWSEKAREHFEKELQKMERYNVSMPEYSIQYSYLDMLLNLPWDNFSESDFTLKGVRETLDSDHYGLEKVKERIVEYMAVCKLRGDMKAPILCLYGPPGVGKTSLGKSVAAALGREYHRVALGGVSDEAEIRGHRRTYVGAMAGRIMAALAKSKTGNPVILLDEIDKMGQGLRGDPAQALLEVLDPEQNNAFHDNYVDFDYDLSNVLFIATANSLSSMSEPLRDRMEIIELTGYVSEEKTEIARRHLMPKALENNGFKRDELDITPEAVVRIIDSYTRESGVRGLEKKISAILRKLACKKVEGQPFSKTIGPEDVKWLLGKEEVFREAYEDNSFAGVVTGLAWTSAGGEILFVETSVSPSNSKGGGKLTLTGQLGDVMKESAAIALEYLRSHASELGIPQEAFKDKDLHIHVPEGAVPKDGPSAGVTMATSIASALTRRKVRPKLAMTGEITLRGKVLPVGGIKEKVLAARRAGIEHVVMSSQNRKDVEEIPREYVENIRFDYVDRLDEVLSIALLDELAEH